MSDIEKQKNKIVELRLPALVAVALRRRRRRCRWWLGGGALVEGGAVVGGGALMGGGLSQRRHSFRGHRDRLRLGAALLHQGALLL